jgi:hypothetical protein
MRRDKTHRRQSFMNILKTLIPKNSLTLEIGVAAGDFSKFMLDNLPIMEHHMVDPWTNEGDDLRSQWFDPQKNDAQISYNFVLDRFKNYPVKIFKVFSNDFFLQNNIKYDLIYVDGDHHSPQVFQDLKNSYNALKSGGILCGDDYNWVSHSTKKQEVKLGVQMFERETGVKFNIIKGDGDGLDQYFYQKFK